MSTQTAQRPRLRSRLRLSDMAGEAIAGLSARPARSVLTVLGTVLGITALVATLGVSRTAGNRIVARFDALAATEVDVEPNNVGGGGAARQSSLPWDAEPRLARLNGVVAAGTISEVDLHGAMARTTALRDPSSTSEFAIPVRAASPGLFRAVRAELRTGRTFDAGHDRRRDRVAVLGPAAAELLGVSHVDHAPAVFIGDRLYVVIGVLSDVVRRPDLLDAIVIPDATAHHDFNLAAPAFVVVDTRLGAASTIARQAPRALDPSDPARLRASTEGEPTRVRDEVAADVDGLFLVLGGVSLLVGAIGIANVTLVSVLERIGEIGLRRALGAGRRHIAAQFLAESTVLGLLGGAVGTALGVLATVVIAASREWTPVMDARVPLSAPALGALVGLVAGVYPALRAASSQPVDALRSGT